MPAANIFSATVDGHVPLTPSDTSKFLRADGTFAVPSGNIANAVGDGVADDTAKIQSVLTSGKIAFLGSGKTYLITTRLNITVAGTGIVGDGTATILMGAGSGQFDNESNLAADRYAANAVGVSAINIARPIFKGVRITYQTLAGRDNRVVKPLHFQDCTDIVVDYNEAWDFKKGAIFAFNGCTRGSVSFSLIRDSEISSATTGQLTGIEFDNDTATGSSGISVIGNRSFNLTASAAFIAAFGYQTDGINLVGNDAKVTHHLRIEANWVSNVGEGIDCFGSDNIIVGNHFDKCYLAGGKFVHGASRNIFAHNLITEAGLAGIGVSGSSSAVSDTADNYIFGNTIYKIDPNAVWAANDSTGINIAANGGTTYLPRRNKFWNNQINCNSTGKYGMLALAGAGTLNSVRRNPISNATVADTLLDATVVPDLELDKPAANTFWGNPTGATALAKFMTAAELRTAAGLGTAATQNTGTSGVNVPLLNAGNTYGGYIYATKPIATARANMTLVNGLNDNIANPGTGFTSIIGPTAAFSVGGVVAPAAPVDDGAEMVLFNTTNFVMTIVDRSGTSAAANRIDTLTGADIVLGAGSSVATLKYETVNNRWFVKSFNG